MDVSRRTVWYLAAIAGILVFGGALAVLLVPPLRTVLPVEPLLDAAGNDYLLVAAFGAVALVALVAMMLARAVGRVRQATPPAPESVERVPILGAEFDELLENGAGVRAVLFGGEADRLRDRLREAATRTLMRKRTRSREAARELVETGAWTDRHVPSAFLAGRDVPVEVRVRAAVRGRTWLQFAASETADEIARLADERQSAGDQSVARPSDDATADPSSTVSGRAPPGRAAVTDGGEGR